jgi:lysophospholipase L1-like esterase
MRTRHRGIGLALLAALLACRREPAPAALTGEPVVLCAGDSITAAAYPAHLQRRLREAGLGLQVVNAGVKGNTSGEYLGFLRRSRLIERTQPRWVLLQLGTNDVRIDGDATPVEAFRANLAAILDLFAAQRNPDGSSPRVLLATIPPIVEKIPGRFDETSATRVDMEINPAIRAIAAQRGIPVVDNHRLFVSRPELLPGIHPSEEGYRALGDSWYTALQSLLVAHDRRAASGA